MGYLPKLLLVLTLIIGLASCSRCYKCNSSFTCQGGGVSYNEEHCLKWGEQDVYRTNPCCIPQ